MSSHRPPQLPGAFVVQPGRGVPLVVFDPHPPSFVIPQSKRVIRVPGHVLNVAVQAHVGIEKHGDGRPGPLREATLQEVVYGSEGLSQARGSGDHTPVPEQPQQGISLVGPRPHSPGATRVFLVRRPQVQQLHEIGFGGLVRDDPASRFHFSHCRHLSLQTPMALKHHAAPQFFWILNPPGEGAPRRHPAAARFATRPRTSESPSVPRLGFEHESGQFAAALSNRCQPAPRNRRTSQMRCGPDSPASPCLCFSRRETLPAKTGPASPEKARARPKWLCRAVSHQTVARARFRWDVP